MNKTYLGDGVYLNFDDRAAGAIVLTTADGLHATNRIFLEPEVVDALVAVLGYVKKPEVDG